MDQVRLDAPRGQPRRHGRRDGQGFTLADDQFRGQNNVDTTTAATVSVSHQLTISSEDRTMREDAKFARLGDTRSFGDDPVEQERVNDTRARCDLSLVARLGGHSAHRTHRGQERFPSHEMVRNVVGDASFDLSEGRSCGAHTREQGCIEPAITITMTLGDLTTLVTMQRT